MNKNIISYSLALLCGLPLSGQAQTIGFESQDYKSLGVYDKWEHSPFRTGMLPGNVKVVNNPDKSVDPILGKPANGSELAVGFQRSRLAGNIFGARIDLSSPLRTAPTSQFVHVLVKSPKAGRLMLMGLGKRAERADQSTETEQFWVRSQNKVDADKWSDAVFEVKTAPGVDIYSLVVVPDMESTHALAEDYAVYIDDIVINNDPVTRIQRSLYPLNFDATATVTRTDRFVKSVGLGTQSIPVYGSVTNGKSTVYKLIGNKSLAVRPGETVQPKIGYNGGWMDGYVYVDFDNNGFFSFGLNPDGRPAAGSNIVSYTYYSPTETTGTNSAGESVNKGNHVSNSEITCPRFVVPEGTPYGFYRMRYKVDWNNVDPGGAVSSSGSIIDNGGGIIDVRLNVHPEKVRITDANRNGEVLDGSGQPLGYEIPFGTPFKIKVRPENGFTYRGVRIRHGYNINGDSLIHDTPQYVDVIVLKNRFDADNTFTIPAELIDGDVLVEGLFVSEGTEFEEDFYPIAFDKNEPRTRTDRVVQGVGLNGVTVNVNDEHLMYHNLTSQSFVAKPGQSVKPSFAYKGNWMNGCVYLDKNHSGYFEVSTPGASGALQAENDLVSFSGLTLANGMYNSAGEQLSNLNTLNTPVFTVPGNLTPGFYRMRYKVDWDSSDPEGRIDEGNSIISNAGGIVDVRLHVTDRDSVLLTDRSEHGTLFVLDKMLNGAKQSIGQGFTITAVPEDGYRLKSITVRHGILDGDSIVNHVAQYVQQTFSGNQIIGGMLNVPATLVDGDMEFTAEFEPSDEPQNNYVLVFNDEFNQPSGTQPDPEKWVRSKRFGSTWNRWISNSNEVVYIQDSTLVLRAIPNPDKSTDNVAMLTGSVETQGKYAFTYGKVDVRMKTIPHTGNFPAAWFMPQPPTQNWPNGGEIDLFEAIDASNTAFHTVHTHWTYDLGNKNNPQSSASEYVNVADWHVYSLEWTEDELKWFVDGRQVFRYTKSTDQQALNNGQWPFDKPFYIILNQSVGNGSWAQPADTNFTYESRVDYVRVYQLQSTGINYTDSSTAQRVENDKIYDLTGREVQKPLAPGIYIRNGKKIAVR